MRTSCEIILGPSSLCSSFCGQSADTPALIVWKCSNASIRCETPKVKLSTCSLMYSRKASLHHRPTRLMIIVEIPERNIAIAPPERIEWRPISNSVKPNTSLPINITIARSLASTCIELISVDFPSSFKKLQSFDSSDDPGIDLTRFTFRAVDLTGQRTASDVLNMWTE